MTPNYNEIIPKLNEDLRKVKETIVSRPERIRGDFANLALDVKNQLDTGNIWEMVPSQIGTLSMSFTVDGAGRKMLFKRPGVKDEVIKQLLELPITAIDEMMINMIEAMQLADIQWIPVFTQPDSKNR